MASSSLPQVQSFGGQWSTSSSLQPDNSNVDGGGGGGNSSSITSAGILPSVLLPAAFGAPSSVFHHGPQQFLQSGAFLPREQGIEHKVASRDHRHNGGFAQMRRRNVGRSSSQILHSGGITGQRR
jgi:hypothetical protein